MKLFISILLYFKIFNLFNTSTYSLENYIRNLSKVTKNLMVNNLFKNQYQNQNINNINRNLNNKKTNKKKYNLKYDSINENKILNSRIKESSTKQNYNYCTEFNEKLFNLTNKINFERNEDNDATINLPLSIFLNNNEFDCGCFNSILKNNKKNIGNTFLFIKNNKKFIDRRNNIKIKKFSLLQPNNITRINKKKELYKNKNKFKLKWIYKND